MIINKIIKENKNQHEAFVYKYIKTNAKPDEKKFYLGIHKGTPSDLYHHSSTDDDLDLDINNSKTEFDYKVLHYGTLSEMKTKEHSLLKLVNAKDNLEWYNKTNGSPSNVGDIDLKFLSDMADQIKENNSFQGIEPVIKTYRKKTMRSTIRKEFKKVQVRFEEIITSNTKKISSWIDKYMGDIEALKVKEKINLLVVVLKDVIDAKSGDKRDLIVGGNHTIEGTLSSKHGKQVRYLIIPAEVHCLDYDSAIHLGSFLNKPEKQPNESSSEPSILKQLILLCQQKSLNSKSEQVEECLDLNECDPEQRIRLKTKLTKSLKKNLLASSMWRLYDNDQGRIDIVNRKKQIEKIYPMSRIFTASSGLVNIGKMMVDITNEIKNGMTYNNVVFLIHHPSPEAQQKWFAEYYSGNNYFVEMTCDALVNKHNHMKELNHDFLYMDTTVSDTA